MIQTLFQNNPELIRGSMADVLDAGKARADYESSAPTGSEVLPSMADVEGWEQILIGISTKTGQIVTPEKAKRCATVLAIMRGLSEDVSCLALPLYKRGPQQDTIAIDHPVYQILNVAPNEWMTPLEVREHLMFDAMLWGHWYNLINFDGTDDVSSIWPLQGGYVYRRWRELVWTFSDPTTGISGQFLPDDVWRGTILSPNGLDGAALTLYAREAIGLLLAAEEQGARLFSHGVQTDLALEMPPGEMMDADQKKQLRKAFMQRHSGSMNAFMPMLLEGGLKATKIGLTAQESQYLDARGFQVGEIARAFRFPEVLLGSFGKSSKSSTYASAEQFFESYTKHTLGPWATRIEQTGMRDLLSPKERAKYYLRHDFSTLLKANETARIANWNAKIQGGWAQPAEARRAEGLPYKDGLEYFSRPAGSTGVAKPDPQLPDPAQTDQSALARRVAAHLFSREQKALIGSNQEAHSFYANFGSYVEQLTGASPLRIVSYLEMRRNTPESERFSIYHTDAALSALTSLCIERTGK